MSKARENVETYLIAVVEDAHKIAVRRIKVEETLKEMTTPEGKAALDEWNAIAHSLLEMSNRTIRHLERQHFDETNFDDWAAEGEDLCAQFMSVVFEANEIINKLENNNI